MWTRDNASGYWTSCQLHQPPTLYINPADEHAQGVKTQALLSDDKDEYQVAAEEGAGAAKQAGADVALDQLLRQSMVLVEVEIPHVALMDGVHAKSFTGTYFPV